MPAPPRDGGFMDWWLNIADKIDRFNERAGRIVYWFTLAMVLIGAFNTIVRYLGQYTGMALSSNAYIELQWYFFSLVFLLGAAYGLKHNEHVRVDVIYGQLSKKVQTWIDLLGTVFFLIPFCLLIMWISWPFVQNSLGILEASPDPGGLPRYPIKTVILLSFALLLVQGLADLIRQIGVLRGVEGAERGTEEEQQLEGI